MSDPLPPDRPDGPIHAELAGLLLSGQTVSGLLTTIVGLAASAIGGVDAASITLMNPGGRLETTSATSGEIRRVDEAQYRDRLGPCVEAIQTGTEVAITLPEERWREFSDRAQQAGMGSVHSFPLRVREQVTGALNLYSSRESRFEETQIPAARSLAQQAATVLANAAALTTAELANEHLERALANRDLIGQAKGILMARELIDADAAFDVLRRRSQQTGRKLRDVAAEVAAEISDATGRG